MTTTRRSFMAQVSTGVAGAMAVGMVNPMGLAKDSHGDLQGLTGITTGSFVRNLSPDPAPGKLWFLDLPRIMRDELGMKVLDVMTACFPSMEPAYLDDFRNRAEKNNCLITNLKMNQAEFDIGAQDPELRRVSIEGYKRTIDAAERLGCRWVRPLPKSELPSWEGYVAGYRELIDYAGPKGISLLVENYGWMQDDHEAIPALIRAVGDGLKASPDIGNWTDEVRYVGLEKAFPLAVTCDFKAREFDAQGVHPLYDLKRCFRIGWDAGFRGPWCFEHFNGSLPQLLKEMVMLREMIEKWTREAKG